MDFGEILDEWERTERERDDSSRTPQAKSALDGSGSSRALEAWLAEKGVRDKDAEAEGRRADRGLEARRLAELKPQALLDLHGMKAEEAKASIASFVEASSRQGLEKVLLIHGKGLHSAGEPMLKKVARQVLEALPLAGRFGPADKADGGSGALWVLIRRRAP
jgi:DNA-nicking Smr family endonuclease